MTPRIGDFSPVTEKMPWNLGVNFDIINLKFGINVSNKALSMSDMAAPESRSAVPLKPLILTSIVLSE